MTITETTDHNTPEPYAAFIAIDWADQKHAFSLQEAGQSKKETGTLEQKPEVIGSWVAKLRQRFGGRPLAVAATFPAETPDRQLDHILTDDPGLRAGAVQSEVMPISDHRPLVVDLEHA